MEALASYDSDDENNEKFDFYKDEARKSSRIAGDNYDNVQMDLSEENSSSSSKAGGQSGSKDNEEHQFFPRSDRSGGGHVRDEGYTRGYTRRDKDEDYKHQASPDERKKRMSPNEDRKRKGSAERESSEHKRRSSMEKQRSSERDGRKRASPERRHHSSRHYDSKRADKYRSDDRRSYESRHSKERRSRDKSPPSRRRSHSRERRGARRDRHARSRSPISSSKGASSNKTESSSSPAADTDNSPPAMTSEQYLASCSLAQKLAQQVQPPKTMATSITGLPGLAGNPSVSRIQEQLQRRRMLWQQSKQPEPKESVAGQSSNNNWEGTLLPKDEDGKMTAKFKRLMGMKGAATETAVSTTTVTPTAQEQLKKQDDMFNNMERQYEVARLATHTHRGLGLGFGAFQCNYPR